MADHQDGCGDDRLADSLGAARAARLDALRAGLEERVRAEVAAIASQSREWTGPEIACLLRKILLAPERFVADDELRRRLLPVVYGAVGPETPVALRDAMLERLSGDFDLDFDTLEGIQLAWGAVRRASREREIPFSWDLGLRMAVDSGRISLSVYSLPSSYLGPETVASFLRAVRAAAPARTLAVLTDARMSRRLERQLESLDVHVLASPGGPYTPWIRDPMSFVRQLDEGVVLLLRPNPQLMREADALMGRELVRNLPPEIDAALGPLRWSSAPIPFHNGQLLPMPGESWLSLHSLERRALELLELERVPVERFADSVGIDEYLAAARRAAAELERLYGEPVRFVHPLPDEGSIDVRQAAMFQLGGGAGFDLDSLVTLLPRPGLASVALVADLRHGLGLLRDVSDAELQRFAHAYELAPAAGQLRQRLLEALLTQRASNLQSFLDLIAEHLVNQGMETHRLPLLLVPSHLLDDRPDLRHQADFVVGWQNVVAEWGGGRPRAEGFASLLESGDRRVDDIFRRVGYDLVLLPPLLESVRRNGGYRCASNHLYGPLAAKP